MYCPKCGQQQVSDEMRFCSRCGFQLAVVSALIATGGASPAVVVADSDGDLDLKAKRNKRQGAKLMFVSGVVMPIAMGLSILVDSPLPLLIPMTIFLAGLAWMYYFRWFGDDVSFVDQRSPQSQLIGAKQSFLPTSQSLVTTFSSNHSHHTAEIIQPPSVTERTTRLLEAEEEKL